ncbi:MAG: aldo/keto reductase [Armatimonadota bacterium]|nr:aldo/keto reductase [Armatimonadota bacterium]
MRMRALGRSGLITSALGLGCMSMSGSYGRSPGDEEESEATIRRAYQLGVTFFDTADVYGNGHNEELVGRAVRPFRRDVAIATKFGSIRDAQGRPAGISGRPEYVRQAAEASLRRLGVDVIDLYYQHRVDPETPIEDTVGAMAELVRAGKVRYLGLSEAAAGTIRRAHAVHPIAAVQSEYSLWTRDPEDGVLATCRALGIGFVAYSPLGRGFLTGTLRAPEDLAADDRRRIHPRFHPENFVRNLALVDRLREMAAAKGCTLPQLAIAWVLAQGEDIVPIPGAKRRAHLEDNLGALEVELTPADLDALNTIAPPGVAAGERYPPDAMGAVNR